MADQRTYIRVHDGMPDHPKVLPLSDKAFRLLVETWAWCSHHLTDGLVTAAVWKKRSTPAARKQLIAAGLAEVLDNGDIQMHDYLEHQRSAAEVAERIAAKSKSGTLGNHVRHHVQRGISDPNCEHCRDPKPVAKPSQVRSQTARKSSLSTETETDTEERPSVVPRGSVDHHLQVGDARPETDDDEALDKLNETIEGRIIEVLREETTHTVDRIWASKIRRQILDGRDIRNPLAYAASAIRGEPAKYLPVAGGLHDQPPPELNPVDDDVAIVGAARARELLAAKNRAEP